MFYLKIVVTKMMPYISNVAKAADKTEKVLAQLSSIILNIGGTRKARKKTIDSSGEFCVALHST